ncbi:nuA4 complex subunit EAF3 homolog [Drosophila bipectinata]|uniref:nuA4 complex subunit EAF3 homolog n=1 Tax=Drosophila bipectinata TaxID=42026 RepID=UPI001C8A9CB0|nr:nuA4 complex subunit EAF3 homolog [Drosophila bipectinata]
MGEVKPAKVENWSTGTDANTLFTDGERVLCFHGPLIYEAKVLKSKPDATPVEYYIHYAGWSKNWDEWVPESRVLKYNEDNVKRRQELARQCGERSKKDNKKGSAKAKKMEQIRIESRASTPSKDSTTSQSTASSTPTASTGPATKTDAANTSSTAPNSATPTATSRANRKSTQSASASVRPGTPSDKKDESTAADTTEDEAATPVAPKKKRMSEQRPSLTGSDVATTEKLPPTTPSAEPAPCVESEESYAAKLEVKIKIPDELKHYLTDDWYAVVREHKLLELPAKVTVQQIAEQYLAHKKSVKSTSASKEVAINDVLDGIVEYFNVMLGSQLLYKFERTQYADVMQKHPDTPLSELYGSFHLLRLFVRLGSMLSYSALDQQSMQNLLVHLQDFLKFLVKNSAMYFNMSNFINVDPEYVRNAQ